MSDLGSQRTVRTQLKRALALQAWKTPKGKRHHWIARPPSKRVNVEVIGSPVRQVSVLVPIAKGAGTVVGQFVNQYASEEARLWVAETLREYGDRITEPIDQRAEFGDRAVQVQGFLEVIVVTVTAL